MASSCLFPPNFFGSVHALRRWIAFHKNNFQQAALFLFVQKQVSNCIQTYLKTRKNSLFPNCAPLFLNIRFTIFKQHDAQKCITEKKPSSFLDLELKSQGGCTQVMLLYKQPLTLVHQKYSFRIADLVCYQQKNLSKLWLETFTTTAFQYRLMKEMSLFRDKLSVQSNHSCMYYVVLRMILQLYKSILTSTQSRPFLGFHCSCATATFYNRFQLR